MQDYSACSRKIDRTLTELFDIPSLEPSLEFQMGDIPNNQRPSGDDTNSSRVDTRQYGGQSQYREAREAAHDSRQNKTSQSGYPNPYSPPISPQGQQDAFNMNSMGHELSNVSYQGYGFPPHPAGFSANQYQMQNSQFASQRATNQQMQSMQGMPYNTQYQNPYAGTYHQGLQHGVPITGSVAGLGGIQYYQASPFPVHSQLPPSPYFFPPTQYRGQSQVYPVSQVMSGPSPRISAAIDSNLTGVGRAGSGRSESIGMFRSHEYTE